jgi:hypothetical protein
MKARILITLQFYCTAHRPRNFALRIKGNGIHQRMADVLTDPKDKTE